MPGFLPYKWDKPLNLITSGKNYLKVKYFLLYNKLAKLKERNCLKKNKIRLEKIHNRLDPRERKPFYFQIQLCYQ